MFNMRVMSCYSHNGTIEMQFLGTFTRLRKGAIRFIMSVRPSVCPNEAAWLPLDGSSWSLIFQDFWKSLKKIQVSLKS